jgi:hypothetical protein
VKAASVDPTPCRDNRRAGDCRSYRAYGLLFRSSIPLPELVVADSSSPPTDRHPDVTITVGSVPKHLDLPLRKGRLLEVDSEKFLLRVQDVGRFLVSRGNEILIEPDVQATEQDVRVFLLGTCFGGLLHQRGLLVLHASAIRMAQGAVLFTGASGAGKSTLLAEMLRRGMPMMVDDVCAIRVDAGRQPVVIPSYPRTRLWATTAASLAIDTSGLPRTRPNMEKFERQVPDQFWDEEAPLVRIYHLAGPEGHEFSLKQLSDIEAFQTVLEDTYRRLLLVGETPCFNHFQLVASTARSVAVVRVARPMNSFRLTELADLVMNDLEVI